MKITKRQLRQIIAEELSLAKTMAAPKKEVSEVGMAVNQLQATAATALELSDLIREMDHVPEWADGKISVVLNSLTDIRAYMVGKQIGQVQLGEAESRLQESIVDQTDYQSLIERVSQQLSDNFGEDMRSLFQDERDFFSRTMTEMDWDEQVTYAQQDLDSGIVAAIERAIQDIESRLHAGEYADV